MTDPDTKAGDHDEEADTAAAPRPPRAVRQPSGEVNGPKGPEPTRFGDWETNGRCSDF